MSEKGLSVEPLFSFEEKLGSNDFIAVRVYCDRNEKIKVRLRYQPAFSEPEIVVLTADLLLSHQIEVITPQEEVLFGDVTVSKYWCEGKGEVPSYSFSRADQSVSVPEAELPLLRELVKRGVERFGS